MDPATAQAMMSGMAGLGAAAPSSAYQGPVTTDGRVYVEGMRINSDNSLMLYAAIGVLAFLLIKRK